MPATTRLPDLDPRQAAALLAGGDAALVDVREPGEWAAGMRAWSRENRTVVTDDGVPGTIA